MLDDCILIDLSELLKDVLILLNQFYMAIINDRFSKVLPSSKLLVKESEIIPNCRLVGWNQLFIEELLYVQSSKEWMR